MGRTKTSSVTIDPRLGNTYHNLRREAMTDERLLPEIRTEVEKIFLQSTTAEFQPIVIFPDISPKGCTGMLTLVSIVYGENLERRDATHIDPKYGGFINRKLAEMLRAKRVVRVSECWVSTYEKTWTPKPISHRTSIRAVGTFSSQLSSTRVRRRTVSRSCGRSSLLQPDWCGGRLTLYSVDVAD